MDDELQGYRSLTGLSADQLTVVGFVTIAWNLLERGIDILIAQAALWDETISDFVTADLGNVSKAQLLSNLVTLRITDARLREESLMVLAFFDELRSRRNNLIHATMDWSGVEPGQKPNHSKRSAKAGKGAIAKMTVDLDLKALRQLGADLALCYEGMMEVYFKVHSFNYFHRHPKPGDNADRLFHYLHETGGMTYEKIARSRTRLKALRSQSGAQGKTQPLRPPSQRKQPGGGK